MNTGVLFALAIIVLGFGFSLWVLFSIPRFLISRVRRGQRLHSLRAVFWLDPAQRLIEQIDAPFRRLDDKLNAASGKVLYWESMLLSAEDPAGPYAARPDQRVNEILRAQKHLARFQKRVSRLQAQLDIARGRHQSLDVLDLGLPDDAFEQVAELVAALPDQDAEDAALEVNLSKDEVVLPVAAPAPAAPAPAPRKPKRSKAPVLEIKADDLGDDLDALVVPTPRPRASSIASIVIPDFDEAERRSRAQHAQDQARKEASSPRKPRKPRAKKSLAASGADGEASSS